MKGDVVKVTHWLSKALRPPQWGVLTDNDRNIPDIMFLSPRVRERIKSHAHQNDSGLWCSLLDDGDIWVVVPPEEWPEDVCVEVAKWRLLEGD